ncbi:hypothetical protein CVIRNUC_008588 [Coccomyxa viridis]|uniref:Uncharacterized protein n=1 Tax=Coccomyxa viridis TaxID=1274662 RepID=A0AAV1IFZ1_9CHLO|nr:hypothetical protein CVIRNUC_008588 [Coccomyxa viridis]
MAELNPKAPNFVPGMPGAGREEAAQNGRGVSVVHADSGPARKGRSATENKAEQDGEPTALQSQESDLSRALRGSLNGHASQPQRTQQTAAFPDRSPDSAILGKSPSSRLGYTSANHLLNFQYQSHQRGRGGAAAGARGRAGSGRRAGPRPQPYNRNKFLQANFRFLVSDAADLRRHEADADLMLDWDDVVQVEMLTAHEINCPISLEAPVCPQITPCGHVFAFPSIMAHLMSHGGDNLRKASPCPLCFQPIVARELRLVQIKVVTPPKAGDTVTFSLLKRARRSIIPCEVGARSSDDMQRAPAGDQASTEVPSAPQAVWTGKSPPAHENGSAATGGTAATQNSPDTGSVNRFAKFGATSDATPMWQAAAEQLSKYAAEVTTEGGFDAAMEAPYIYAAIDALALRAGKWAERRQRLILEGVSADAAVVTPEAASAAAIAAVKEMTNAASDSAKHDIARRAAEAARAAEDAAAKAALVRDFPSLRPSLAPPPPQRGWEVAHAAAAKTQGAETAFSDDEFEPLALQFGHSETPQNGTAASSPSNPKEAEASDLSEDKGIPIVGSSAASKAPDAAGSATSASGSSPPDQASFLKSNEYYFYQASDGQWLFLTALDMRVLLAHHGAYSALPGRLAAQVVNIDQVTQTEAVRKRTKFLGHLPLTGAFQLAEVDLAALVPEEALVPFAEELQSRDRRRERRVKEEAQQAARDAKQAAARAAALAASTAGPSAAELKAMPLPSASLRHFLGGLTEEEALTNALTASLAEDSSGEEEGGPATRDEAAMPQSGISFAKMTAMGFAATGPSLPASSPGGMSGTSPGALQRPAWGKALAAHPTQPLSTPGVKLQAWGITSQKQLTPGTAMPVAPAPISWLEPSALSAHSQEGKREDATGGAQHASPAPKEQETKEGANKKKKGQKQQTLLFTTAQRRY